MSHWKDRETHNLVNEDPIDYSLIAKAIDYYGKQRGYRRIDVPWLVDQETVDITKPTDARTFATFDGCLVASGEQSFLQLREAFRYSSGSKFQCVTPCFRDERHYDHLRARRQYFLKHELIVIGRRHDIRLEQMNRVVADALAFFGSLLQPKDYIELVDTTEGQDIKINGEEVGSYGMRNHEDFAWIYGTGCAEPRLSYSLRLR